MALSDLTDDEWLARLTAKRTAFLAEQERLWTYYDNEQPLAYVARILAEQDDRFPPLMINWAGLVVDSLEERLDIEGFRIGDSDELDEDLYDIWQANDLDEGSGEGHICSMVTSTGYHMLGPGVDSDTPRITMEYPDQVAVETDPATRRIVAALKVWKSDEALGAEDMACLYLPGRTITYQQGKRGAFEAAEVTREGWAKALEDQQTSPLVPVVPMLNRPRRGKGHTELKAIIPLVDAANQTATNMLAGIEHHALPRRWGINLSRDDFVDAEGRPLPAWKIAAGYVWAVQRPVDENGNPLPSGEGDRPQIGQFTASDLSNFHNSLRQISTLAASLYGLPPHYLGYSTENPASADAIRSSEARLIKRAERHQRTFGGSWEQTMRIALAMIGRDPSEANRLETVWRDASTPTASAVADRAVKLVQAGIIDREQAREDIGYTPAQRRRMAERESDMGNQAANIVAGLRGLNVGDAAAQTNGNVAPAPGVPAREQQPERPPVNGAPARASR